MKRTENRALDDCVALVTGAAGNIGSAICNVFRAQGARVYATDLNPAHGIAPHDVTSAQSWATVVSDLRENHGKLDLLVNCAGIAPMAKLPDITLDEWRRCFTINVESALLGMQATLPLLQAGGLTRAGGASVINIASAAANKPTPMSAAYCSSKAALVMLSKVAALEYAREGFAIRVNTVNPGAVESDMIEGILQRYAKISNASENTLRDAMRADVPAGRLARPDDVADAVLYLASSASRFVTGSELMVDGGLTA